MRYLPMAALFDGEHYMVERFNDVLFTPESYGHMTATADAARLRSMCSRWACRRVTEACRRCPA